MDQYHLALECDTTKALKGWNHEWNKQSSNIISKI